jgi:hypothetical protein
MRYETFNRTMAIALACRRGDREGIVILCEGLDDDPVEQAAYRRILWDFVRGPLADVPDDTLRRNLVGVPL